MYKKPACTEFCLRMLYEIIQALQRASFVECIQRTETVLATIQNEIEWCFNTDPALTAMRTFFEQLTVLVRELPNDVPSNQKTQVQEITTYLKKALQELSEATAPYTPYPAPAASLDQIEVDYRNAR